jgi:formate-dependent nitrite reductase membrane component NrfD
VWCGGGGRERERERERRSEFFKKIRLKNIILIIYGILMGIYCGFYLCREAKSSLDP